MTNCHMYQAKYALYISPDGNVNNGITSFNVSNTYFDSTTTHHIFFGGKVKNVEPLPGGNTTKIYREFLFSNCYFRDCSSSSILVNTLLML